jgi:hypothetical protein
VRLCHIRCARDPAASSCLLLPPPFYRNPGVYSQATKSGMLCRLAGTLPHSTSYENPSNLNALSARGRRICLVLDPTERKREALGDPHPCTFDTPDPTQMRL